MKNINLDILIDKENTTDSNTKVFDAFAYGNLALIKYFVEEKAINPLEEEGDCTLFYKRGIAYDGNDLLKGAILNGHFDVVVEEKRVDVNHIDKDGWTPLMIAIEQGHTAILNRKRC